MQIAEKFQGNLRDFISEPSKITFLVGAGVSMDPPTNLPSAVTIGKNLIEFFAHKTQHEALIALNNLRYELLVECVQNQFDKSLKIMNYFDLAKSPNLLHYFLAHSIRKKSYIFTTNFDYCIEFALKSIIPDSKFSDIIPIITFQDYLKYSEPQRLYDEDKYPIYKIHGSKSNCITKEETKDSLITRMSDLGKYREGQETFAIEKFKKPATLALTKGRVLVVMGYSGSDDFDIGPLLKELTALKGLIWIDHKNEVESNFEIIRMLPNPMGEPKKSQNSVISKVDLLLSEICQYPHFPILKISGNTSKIIETVFWKSLLPKIKKPPISMKSTLPDYDCWLRKLFKTVTPEDGYGFAATLFTYLSHPDQALNCFLYALKIMEDKGIIKNKVEYLNEIGNIMREKGDFEQGMEYFNQALVIAEREHNLKQKSGIINNIGMILHYQGSLDAALSHFQDALEISKELEDTEEISNQFINLGNVYYDKGELENSILNFNKAMDFFILTGDLAGKSLCLNNIGDVYKVMGKYNDALFQYLESLEISEKIGDLIGKSRQLNRIGLIYYNKQDFSKALEKFTEGLSIASDLGLLSTQSEILNNIGLIHSDQGNYDNGIKNFKESLIIADRLGDKFKRAGSLNNLGTLYEAKGDYDSAITNYKDMLLIMEEIGALSGKSIGLNNIGMIYQKKGDIDAAISYYSDALEIANKMGHIKNKTTFLSNIGYAYHSMDQFNDSLKYIKEAYDLNIEMGLGDTEIVAQMKGDIETIKQKIKEGI